MRGVDVVSNFGRKNFDISPGTYVLIMPERSMAIINKIHRRIFKKSNAIQCRTYRDIVHDICDKQSQPLDKNRFIDATLILNGALKFNELILLRQRSIGFVSETCMGGALAHILGLKFLTPFVNIRVGFSGRDFFDICENTERYYSIEPEVETKMGYDGFEKMGYEGRIEYPVMYLDTVPLHGFHYKDVKEMKEKWALRHNRWELKRSIIMKIFYSEEDVERFRKIKRDKLLGFYYRKVSDDNIIYIPFPYSDVSKYAYGYAGYLYDLSISGRLFKESNLMDWLVENTKDL